MGAGALWGAKSINDATGGKAAEIAKQASQSAIKSVAGYAFDDSSKPETKPGGKPETKPEADDSNFLQDALNFLGDNKGGLSTLMAAATLWWKGPELTKDLAFWIMVGSAAYLAYQNWPKSSFNNASANPEAATPDAHAKLNLGQEEMVPTGP